MDRCRKWPEGERATLLPKWTRVSKAREPRAPSFEELEQYAGEGMLGRATAVFKGERPAAVSVQSIVDM